MSDNEQPQKLRPVKPLDLAKAKRQPRGRRVDPTQFGKENADVRNERTPEVKANDGEEEVVVEKELQKLSLHAVRQWKDTLLYSQDERERNNIASKVMDATGHSRRESAQIGAGSIIVINGLSQGAMPWALPKSATVEGQLVKPENAQIPSGHISGEPTED